MVDGMKRFRMAMIALLVGACTSGGANDGPGEATSQLPTAGVVTGSADPSSSAADAVLEDRFDVGGHELFIRCSGTGSPTVVYLHGSIPDPAFLGHSSALEIQEIVDDRHRMCVYDRTNVGLSQSVAGPLDGESSVTDLHRLLDAAGEQPPYVLLGASFGGLIADIYAATYPEEVVGMVQLDASLPGTLEKIDDRFYAEEDRIHTDDWIGTNEEIDELAVYGLARELEGDLPEIPMTYLASSELPSDPEELEAVQDLRRRFVDRFAPGRLVELDVPHYMEPEIPTRIAQEIERVIVAAGY